jgi:geranylgeranyl diphosphate synthase, type I
MSQKTDFTQTLLSLKQVIDAEVSKQAGALAKDAQKNYTPFSYAVVDTYNQVLSRGGKRIRGALTMVGYDMCGGKNTAMITTAAAAIEMLHSYILILDDIMDKSATRRGGDAAHVLMQKYHVSQHLAGDSPHFGKAEAINGAFIGAHNAQTLIADLDAEDEYKLHALRLMNKALVVTGHGQANDIYNEVSVTVDPKAVDDVFEWKTAHYTFLNPLQFGMALAGADDNTLKSVYDYSMHAGRAFQITDDILGTFASEQEADSADKNFLVQMLGNERITQAEFDRVKEIYQETGALAYARTQAKQHIDQAAESLAKHKDKFTQGGYEFLLQLVLGLEGRSS